MRKYIIIAAAAIVAMASCTKVEKDPTASDQKIGYLVATYMTQTKATTNGSFLNELTSAPFSIDAADVFFKSKAYINADGASSTAEFYNAATTTKVENIKYYSGTTATWEPDHTYYWPKSPNSSLDFFSWYDLSATTADSAAGNVATMSESSGTYTLAWSGRTVALKDNVMYADPVWAQKANKNPGDYKFNSVQEGVPTLFHHALSQVRFQFKQKTMSKADSKKSGYSTFWTVTVKNVSISSATAAHNLVQSGSLSLTTNKTDKVWTVPSPAIWTRGTDYLTNAELFQANAINATGIELTADAATFNIKGNMTDDFITVVPQALEDDLFLNFDITIVTKYGTALASAATVSTETFHINAFPTSGALVQNSGIQLNAMSIGGNWVMNKKYNYIFIVDPETSTILYDPAVVSWDDTVAEATQTVPGA